MRESLETGSEAQAELLRQRVDLEVALLETRLQTLITYLDELGAVQVQNFIEGLGVSRKTMRHYREFFHHSLEVCLRFDLYRPTNWHRPNPVAALPSYLTRNRRITYWLDLLRNLRGMKHMEMVEWLKSQHGMGHGHANALVAHSRANP